MDVIEEFKQAIVAAGLLPPSLIQADGLLYRFATNDRAGDDSGWYVLHPDGIPAGAFGCWRQGVSHKWSAQTDSAMTEGERNAHRQRLQSLQLKSEADKLQRQQEARTVALARWRAAQPLQDHPYLQRKGIQAHGTRVEGDKLLVPMRDGAGLLHSLQLIDAHGDKKYLRWGRVNGCHFLLGRLPAPHVIVCEGFATGATLHEATGWPVLVAFSAGNLLAVAQQVRQQYPESQLVLAGDDDWQSPGNIGHAKALEAAQTVHGALALPVFPEPRGAKDTDFNDLHRKLGLAAVKACLMAVVQAADTVARPAKTLPGQDGQDASEEEWPEPTPLPAALPPVAPFAPQLLPEALREWVADGAERMQCPQDFGAVGMMVALSSLIGARAVVAPKAHDDWRVVPNLWGLVVGRPGVKKTPALAEVLKPLHRLEAQERELWQIAHNAWALECKVAEMATKQNEKQAEREAVKNPDKARALLQPVDTPAEPLARRYMVNDATVEKLGELLAVNPWGLLVYRDEIHGLLSQMDRQGQEGSRAFYLAGYDGNQGHAVDRIGRGEIHIPRVCMAMLGGIQPGKLESYVREAVVGGHKDDGLLQRFGLTVWPDIRPEFLYIDRQPDDAAKQRAWEVFERLNALLPQSDTEPQVWRFSAPAQALFEEWLVPFETELRSQELHPAFISHLSKFRKLVPALALIFALVDTPDSGAVIHERELMRALAWADYLRTHAERVYSAAVMPETSGAQTLLRKLQAHKLHDANGAPCEWFKPRQLALKHWAGLVTPEAVRQAADLLADYGWLQRHTVPTGFQGGRPHERYLLHPRLLAAGN